VEPRCAAPHAADDEPLSSATLAAGASPSPSALPLRPFVINRWWGHLPDTRGSGDGACEWALPGGLRGPPSTHRHHLPYLAALAGTLAVNAQLNLVCLPCGDGAGNYLVPDQTNHVIRFVAVTGAITTVAGVALTAGYSGEGLPATSSRLSSPVSISPYGGGYVIINQGSCRLTTLWPNFTMTTFCGNGVCGSTGDGGPAVLASVNPGYGLGMADSGPWGSRVGGELEPCREAGAA